MPVKSNRLITQTPSGQADGLDHYTITFTSSGCCRVIRKIIISI